MQLLPENAKGLTVEEIIIPLGQNDARITFKLPEDADPGPRQNLTLRAVAVVEGLSISHDLKFNVNAASKKP